MSPGPDPGPEAEDRIPPETEGLIGAGWMENALPATQRACEDLQGLIRVALQELSQ